MVSLYEIMTLKGRITDKRTTDNYRQPLTSELLTRENVLDGERASI